MEKALSEGPGAATGLLLPFFTSSFSGCSPRREPCLGVAQPAKEQRGDRAGGGGKTGSAGRGHRREVGSPSHSPDKFKKSPAKC